jgi:hypothetical protein
MEAQKSVRKEVMAEITEEPHYNTLSIVRNLEEKDMP